MLENFDFYARKKRRRHEKLIRTPLGERERERERAGVEEDIEIRRK